MQLNNVVEIKIVKNDRAYCFYLPGGAPIGEAYDAAFETLQKITDLAKESAEKLKRDEEKKEKKEDKK